MTLRLAGFRLALAMLLALIAGTAHAQCAKIRPTQPGEVYFMRGLANIFSLGLDDFGKEITAAGIENCVFNHSYWQSIVNDVVERSYRGEVSFPIVIIGHSLGANIAPKMATAIGNRGIPVSYVVMLDPVEATVVGRNVKEIHNYFLPKRQDNRLYPGSTFDGLVIENVDVTPFGGYNHFNIDKNRQLRNTMKQRIFAFVEEAKAPPPAPQPKNAPKKK